MSTLTGPERTELAPGLEICRIVTGLWQVADLERDGNALDPEAASSVMLDYARNGFDSFDMADHYGSAEIISGRFLRRVAEGSSVGPNRPAIFTKWCPKPGPMPLAVVREGIARSCDRLGVGKIDLLQFHWWTFEHPAYLDAMQGLAHLQREGIIGHIGVTNFDTAHLHLLVRHGIPVVANQVNFSLLDRRAGRDMSDFCLANGVKLLAYGTLAGGLISERWLNRPEPTESDISDWSKMKYKRFVDAVGGWAGFQRLLACLNAIARKHNVSLSNVASRWVLDQKAVAAIIIGARLGENEHRGDNLKLFAFDLDEADRAAIDQALLGLTPLNGDCGDEYRRPPFLTASGDLSHHLDALPKLYQAEPMPEHRDRQRIGSGSVWESVCGYSRAVRIKDRVLVSGTTATHLGGEIICPGDPAGQATYILDKIAASLASLGANLADVVRTRIYLRNADDWEPVSRIHGRYFGEIRPANTLIEARLVGDYLVEIEAEAIIAEGA
jgi:aryl-alcohol dehydrogenase-like predicted oxidoreductase/enamine deaminase RidA (YjgF/YER057c/UK114 family)